METFASETGVFGLSLLRPHVPLAEKLLWILVGLSLAGMTIKDITNLTRSYLQEETFTYVSTNRHDVLVFDPAPELVFRFDAQFVADLALSHVNQAVLEAELRAFQRTMFAEDETTKKSVTMSDFMFRVCNW